MKEIMEHLAFLTRLFDFTDIKVKIASFYGALLSAMLTTLSSFSQGLLGISAGLFLLLFVIMITDYVTGLKASKKEGVEFISKRGLGWVFKFGSYLVVLSVSLSLRKELILNGFDWLEIPFISIHFYILVHILMWELKSVDENFKRLGHEFKVLGLITDIFLIVQTMLKKKYDK
jgi:phage-related holin